MNTRCSRCDYDPCTCGYERSSDRYGESARHREEYRKRVLDVLDRTNLAVATAGRQIVALEQRVAKLEEQLQSARASIPCYDGGRVVGPRGRW